MSWDKFISEILTNIDNGDKRKVEPIDDGDKKNIVPLNKMEATILWNRYFCDAVKYALQYERTYGEPVETPVFDESKIDSDSLKNALRSMHSDETPILLYWNIGTAIQTTWDMLIKYWDNLFYYPEDAIIYINQDQIYFYNEMILKKMNRLESKSKDSAFDYLKKLEDKKAKKISAMDCLFEGIPSNFQDSLYAFFYSLSESFRAIGNDELRKEYMEHCSRMINSTTDKIVNICKPYNEEALQSWDEFLGDGACDKLLIDNFHEFLKKIIAK